ncbi:tetratricopeptide repeat protein [Leptolyngbya sp. PCC 6406]|uniref:tetratricopeptide repeat protein n=1 Tax=Leptolyngbya sp. PCC 6406 TaxID=1173264 RepID=UPI001CEDF948|nr:tetratricopeptide repeat protein [Leptolyngbya sp. PCC 6406]
MITLLGVGGCDQGATSLQGMEFPQLATLGQPAFLQNPAAAAAYRQRGLQLRQGGEMTDAIATLKTAVALDPNHIPGQVLLGWTQHLAGQRPQAIATLQRALTQQPEDIPALNALGIVYLVEGDLAAAIATHTQAKTLKPDNEIAHYNLSLAYQRWPDLPQAIAHAQQATELEPYNPHPWVALALAHWSAGDRAAAQTAYGTALALDGRYRDRAHLDHLSRAGFSPEQITTVTALWQAR